MPPERTTMKPGTTATDTRRTFGSALRALYLLVSGQDVRRSPADPMPGTAAPVLSEIPQAWLFTPLAVTAALIALEITDLDRIVSNWFYDAGTAAFPLRHTFLFDTVLHHWAKYVVILTTCLIIAAFLLSFVTSALQSRRRVLLFLGMALALAPLTVSALKLVSDRSCPWDLADYGGDAPYTRLFDSQSRPHAPGHCFPAGHASTGFALMAFFFAAHRARRNRLARGLLIAGLSAGLILGFGRIAQGAHFLSHVLWSGLVCWLVMVGLYALLLTKSGTNTVEKSS